MNIRNKSLFFFVLFFLLQSFLSCGITLVDWTTDCFKSLPEFVGKEDFSPFFDSLKGLPKYYPDIINWEKNDNTLKKSQLDEAIEQYIKQAGKDPDFNDKRKWYNEEKIFPNDYFSTITISNDISNPYIQKQIVSPGAEICIIGDLHGSAHSLIRTLWRLLLKGDIDNNLELKKNFYMIFLGDYSDRGVGTAEIWYTLINLKLKNWNNVFILRGNHDAWAHHLKWGKSTFSAELLCKYGKNSLTSFSTGISHVYNLLPLALLIGTENDMIYCAHGGLDPKYDATGFIRNKNLQYDYLNGAYNISIESNNTILWRWYYIEGGKNLIETDVKALDTNYSAENIKTRAIFRGHQHKDMECAFCIIKKGIVPGSDMNYLLPGWDSIPKKDQDRLKNGTYSLSNSNYYPIYTFVSAPGNHTEYDCFAILKTESDFTDWKMQIFQNSVALGEKTYIRLDINESNDDIITSYSNRDKPYPYPVSQALWGRAVLQK